MHWLIEKFHSYNEKEAIIHNGIIHTYEMLGKEISNALDLLNSYKINKHEIIAIIGDYSPKAIAMFFALLENGNVIVPITTKNKQEIEARIKEGYVDTIISISGGEYMFEKVDTDQQEKHVLFGILRERTSSGLILFSSGSTGKPKAILEDLSIIVDSYHKAKTPSKTLVFLMFDHIGGINTMFHILSSGGCLVIPHSRKAEDVVDLIEKHKVEILPASPTFLNLLLISETYKGRDLSSLKTITYGTEPMPQVVLDRLHEIFPNAKLKQTYGLSEVGILSTKSKSHDSLYMKIGGDNFEFKVVDNQLYIKSKIAMLGYLNAPDPFTDDGFFPTGDLVDIDDEGFMRIIGRAKEFINVGGEKVLPTEVEGVILEIGDIKDVIVRSEKNPIMGEMVVAEISLKVDYDKREMKKTVIQHCKERLDDYKIPSKIIFVEDVQVGERFKKKRGQN